MTHGNLNGKDVVARVLTFQGEHQIAMLVVNGEAIYQGTAVDVDAETGEVTLTSQPFSIVVARGVPSSFEMQTADLQTAELRGSVATKPAG